MSTWGLRRCPRSSARHGPTGLQSSQLLQVKPAASRSAGLRAECPRAPVSSPLHLHLTAAPVRASCSHVWALSVVASSRASTLVTCLKPTLFEHPTARDRVPLRFPRSRSTQNTGAPDNNLVDLRHSPRSAEVLTRSSCPILMPPWAGAGSCAMGTMRKMCAEASLRALIFRTLPETAVPGSSEFATPVMAGAPLPGANRSLR